MTFIDMFAGIGGFRSGFEKAGKELGIEFRCAGFCEKDKFAVKSYNAMYNTEGEWFESDISKVKTKELPEAEGICGGFPCQDISVSGRQAGLGGERSGLFYELLRIIRGAKPRWFVLENVENLLYINRGRDFTAVLCALSEVGYYLEYAVLNSADYGVPQSRKRVYIVGHTRSECCGKILCVRQTGGKNPVQIKGGQQAERIYSAMGTSVSLKSEAGGGGGHTGLYFIDLNENGKITENARTIQSRYYKGMCGHFKYEMSGVIIQRGRGYNKGGIKEIAPTLTSRCYDQNNLLLSLNEVQYNYRIRRLTPLECFRLQGFSDEQFYAAQSVNSDNQLYCQAGNAVTVNVAYEIGRKLMQVYGGNGI